MIMGENNELGLGCESLNLENWSIEVNGDVVEKVEQEVALNNWMKEWGNLTKIVRKIKCRISR